MWNTQIFLELGVKKWKTNLVLVMSQRKNTSTAKVVIVFCGGMKVKTYAALVKRSRFSRFRR